MDNSNNDIVAEKLLDTFQEYREDITKVDFSIDIQRLKQDITDKTKKLF
jgi:hypothetical protein